jgi:hypothetical protein
MVAPLPGRRCSSLSDQATEVIDLQGFQAL